MSLTAKAAVVLALVAAAVALGGCQSRPPAYIDVPAPVMQAYLQDKPEPLHPIYRRVLTQGPRNRVLNLLEGGLAAMERGHYDLAAESFDQALVEIESVFGTSEEARRARSLWYDEDVKDFRGEPYERAMAYYYRGLLYMREGDFENARASFRSGLLQDAFAEEQQHRADFALLMLLDGWASHCLGQDDLAREAYAEIAQIRPGFVAPGPDDDTLILVETGSSPRKLTRGAGNEVLLLRRGADNMVVNVELAGPGRIGRLSEDIAWQAMTRGGRPIEAIVAGQVRFRTGADTLGDVLLLGSVITLSEGLRSDSVEGRNVGLALGGAAILSKVLAANVRTRADTRYWSLLPDRVHAMTARADQLPGPPLARLISEGGQVIGTIEADGELRPMGDCGLIWVRTTER